MPNNPYDDLLRNLARLIEQVSGLEQNMRNLQNIQSDTPHIIGCAIIAGGVVQDQEIPLHRPLEVNYEIIDAGEVAYLTIALPSYLTVHPGVEVTEKAVFISAAGSRAPVHLGFSVNAGSCSYEVRNGVVDVILVKEPSLAESSE
jgi:hypothetical protein